MLFYLHLKGQNYKFLGFRKEIIERIIIKDLLGIFNSVPSQLGLDSPTSGL